MPTPINLSDDLRIGASGASSAWMNGVQVWPSVVYAYSVLTDVQSIPPGTSDIVFDPATETDPTASIFLDTDPRYVSVAAGTRLVSPPPGDFYGLIGLFNWTHDTELAADEAELFVTVYDSVFSVVDEWSQLNTGVGGGETGIGVTRISYVMPVDGFIGMHIRNDSAFTLDGPLHFGSLTLNWRA